MDNSVFEIITHILIVFLYLLDGFLLFGYIWPKRLSNIPSILLNTIEETNSWILILVFGFVGSIGHGIVFTMASSVIETSYDKTGGILIDFLIFSLIPLLSPGLFYGLLLRKPKSKILLWILKIVFGCLAIGLLGFGFGGLITIFTTTLITNFINYIFNESLLLNINFEVIAPVLESVSFFGVILSLVGGALSVLVVKPIVKCKVEKELRKLETSSRRLNIFAFPIETNTRFIILIMVALLFIMSLTLHYIEEIGGPYFETLIETEIQRYFMTNDFFAAAGLRIDLNPSPFSFGGVTSASTFFAVLVELVPCSAVAIAIFTFATIAYWRHPTRERKRMELKETSPDHRSELHNTIQPMANEIGITDSLVVEEKGDIYGELSPKTFGLKGKYILGFECLAIGFLKKYSEEFKAVVLHELGHIKDGDVARHYFVDRLWKVFAALILLPSIFLYGIDWLGWLVTWSVGLVSADDSALLFRIFAPLFLICQFIGVGTVIYAIRASILREREFLADWHVTTWGYEEPLKGKILRSEAAKSKIGVQGFNLKSVRDWWNNVKRIVAPTHPSPNQRLSAIDNPIMLFKVRYDLPFVLGILYGFILSEVPIFLSWITTTTYQPLSNLSLPLALEPSPRLWILWDFFQIAQTIINWAAVFVLFGFIALLIGETFGAQVQRERIASLATKEVVCGSYFKLLPLAFLFAIGLQVGFYLIPNNILSPVIEIIGMQKGPIDAFLLRILDYVPISVMWILCITCLVYIWLVQIQFFTTHLIGSHTGRKAPKFKRIAITISTSMILNGVLILGFLAQFSIFGVVWDWKFTIPSNYYIPIEWLAMGFLAMLAVFAVNFGVWGVFLIIKKLLFRSHCPSCGTLVNQHMVLDENCKNCGEPLATWLYVS